MASELFMTINKTDYLNSNGRVKGTISVDTVLECDSWVWDKGELFGTRRIYTPEQYNGFFVPDTALIPYSEPDSDTKAYILLYEEDGTVRRFEEV